MSYDIYLKDPVTDQTVEFDASHQMRGGTYCIGGTTEAWLNVTYNYGVFYSRVFEPRYNPDHEYAEHNPKVAKKYGRELGYLYGIRSIYGLTGAESIPVLERAISMLGDDSNPDYWEPTEGNAKKPLCQLLAMAKMRPDGVWDGD